MMPVRGQGIEGQGSRPRQASPNFNSYSKVGGRPLQNQVTISDVKVSDSQEIEN